MDKFLKRKSMLDQPPYAKEHDDSEEVQHSSNQSRVEVNLTYLPADPGLRIRISKYQPDDNLNVSIDCVRFLLRQGLAFHGHDESEKSNNQGNFLQLLEFLADHDDNIKSIVMKNALKNFILTSPDIHKDIVSAATIETTNAIMIELGDSFFTILIAESCDIAIEDKMAIALRFVDKRGRVIEHFIGIMHITDTTAVSLKMGDGD